MDARLQKLETNMINLFQVAIEKAVSLMANKAPPPNSVSHHESDMSFQPVPQMQRAMGRMEQQLRTYILPR